MINRIHYDAVLKDLRENYDILKGNLEELETALRVLERLYAKPVKSLKAAPAQEVATDTVRAPLHLHGAHEEIVITEPVRVPADSREFTLDVAKQESRLRTCGFTSRLEDVICMAAGEMRHNQIELARRVMVLRPDTTYPSVSSGVSRMLAKGKLHKGEDLIIRNVMDGRVQGLPPVSADASHSHTGFGQYTSQ